MATDLAGELRRWADTFDMPKGEYPDSDISDVLRRAAAVVERQEGALKRIADPGEAEYQLGARAVAKAALAAQAGGGE